MSRPAPAREGGRGNPIQDYVTVAERIGKFYEKYPDGRIVTHVMEHDCERGFALVRAEVYRKPDDAQPSATGHAYEYKSEGYVQRTSYVEVCETSAVGRALAMCGFEVKRGIASREEMQKADRHEGERPQQQPPQPSPRVPAPVVSTEQPIARSMGDLLTPQQLKAIGSIAANKGLNAEVECQKTFKCKPEELSKKAASEYITWLQGAGV